MDFKKKKINRIEQKNKEGNNLKTVKINGCINITEEMKNQMRDAGINVEE